VSYYVAGPPLLNRRCTSLLNPPPRLWNDLYCVECEPGCYFEALYHHSKSQ